MEILLGVTIRPPWRADTLLAQTAFQSYTIQTMEQLKSQFILINKPIGWTSFDVVAYVRQRIHKQCHPKFISGSLISPGEVLKQACLPGRQVQPDKKRLRVGHAGTLDPFATGLLIVGVGRDATKRLDEFKNLPKTYVATIHLGAVSDTGDITGQITPTLQHLNSTTQKQYNNIAKEQFNNLTAPTRTQIESIMSSFIGRQLQIPPMYSAKSVGGQRLYKLARQGKVVEREPSEIEIFAIKLLNYAYPLLKIEVSCSSGTYIRTLAEDIGEKLGVGAYCEELVRTKIGNFDVREAYSLDNMEWLDEFKINE